jgi:purine-binding chemotaxis protein CheW
MSRYISFQVGDGRFAVGLAAVIRILPFENVTRVPLAPQFVEGILNLAGEVVPVINLRTRFSLPPLAPTPRHRVIITGWPGGKYGLLVDKVREIIELGETSIAPASSGPPGLKAEALEGVARIGEVLLFILDVQKLLAPGGGDLDA